MSKKATGIWRYILVALGIVLSVGLIMGIIACEIVDTEDYQENITDETESKSQSEIDSGLNSESEQESKSDSKPQTEPESEKETEQWQVVKGIVSEIREEKRDDVDFAPHSLQPTQYQARASPYRQPRDGGRVYARDPSQPQFRLQRHRLRRQHVCGGLKAPRNDGRA